MPFLKMLSAFARNLSCICSVRYPICPVLYRLVADAVW